MADLPVDIVSLVPPVAKIGFVLAVLMGIFAPVLGWLERKQSALMQDRIGANRADIFGLRLLGLFHPLADAVKVLFKEDFIPERAHRALHTLAPFLAFVPPLILYSVIPFGDTLILNGRDIPLVVADLDVGILFIFAIASLATYGTVLAGWASTSNYSFLGGLRASAQMVSYEVVMGLTIMGVLLSFESIRLTEIARAQGDLIHLFGLPIPKWGIVIQPVGFFMFFIAAIAETKRIPFDLPEGESELVAGYFTEYSGFKFLMFWMAEYIEMVVVAGMVTALFFGGWQIPYVTTGTFMSWFAGWGMGETSASILTSVIQVGAFWTKVAVFVFIQMSIRWTLPRFRYDQIMRLCWKMLLPISLLNIIVTGAVVLWLKG